MNWLGHLRPQAGRDRAALMSCDQLASVLHLNLPRSELRDRFAIHELQDALHASAQDASRAEAFRSVAEPVKDYFATINHELDHLRRQFSTSCGLLNLYLHSQLVASSQQMALEAQKQEDEFPFPLLGRFARSPWLDSVIKLPPDFYKRCQELAPISAMALWALGNAAAIRGLEVGSTIHGRVLSDMAFFIPFEEKRFSPIGIVQPPIEPEIDEWLGAQHLLEHMAMVEELSCRTKIGGAMTEWTRLLSEDNRYRKIMQLWFHFFPNSHVLDQGVMRPGDRITDVYRICPIEFYAILDLALWPPFTSRGFFRKNGSVRWEDIQPGHRFLRGMGVMRDARTRLTPFTADDREGRFDEVQRFIAAELGWETPENLAAAWYDYLLSERLCNDGLFVGHKDDTVFRIARTMLGHRIKSPFNTVCNNLSQDQTQEIKFAVWITNDGTGGHQMQLAKESDDAFATRNRYLLFRGCEMLLFGESPRFESLEEGHRRLAVEIMNHELRCSSWNDVAFEKAALNLIG